MEEPWGTLRSGGGDRTMGQHFGLVPSLGDGAPLFPSSFFCLVILSKHVREWDHKGESSQATRRLRRTRGSRPEALPQWMGHGRGLPGRPGPGAAHPRLMQSSYVEMGFGPRNILIPTTLPSRSLVQRGCSLKRFPSPWSPQRPMSHPTRGCPGAQGGFSGWRAVLGPWPVPEPCSHAPGRVRAPRPVTHSGAGLAIPGG